MVDCVFFGYLTSILVSKGRKPRTKEGQTKGKQTSKQERKHEPRKDKPLAKVERIRALGIGISIA